MESSIASHLVCPRTRERRVDDAYTPPYPAWSARAATSVRQVVMGYFGVQSRDTAQHGKACGALMAIVSGFGHADGPRHHDLAHFVDAQGFDTMIAIAYWEDPARYARWQASPEVAGWWDSAERLREGIGYFREIVSPRVEHYETLFSTPDKPEGVGVAMGSMSADIHEHAYWGSMRDRIPLAQTDALRPTGSLAIAAGLPMPGQRVRIAGHEKVALIRSGQDWIETDGRERALYLQDMEPVLHEGMDFLRDQGTTIGCYTNRYMRHIDARGEPMEKSFGMSFWRSLADMERWAESHPTHVAIFGTFMRIVQELQFQLKLRLYHEVSVLAPDEQSYEYVNCHPRTGLLNGISG